MDMKACRAEEECELKQHRAVVESAPLVRRSSIEEVILVFGTGNLRSWNSSK
jgi:hypothetical protein